MEHIVKIKKQYFVKLLSEEKTFELRKNDRNYKVGDVIILKEIDDYDLKFPFNRGREVKAEITYILKGPVYGLETGYCILAIKLCN